MKPTVGDIAQGRRVGLKFGIDRNGGRYQTGSLEPQIFNSGPSGQFKYHRDVTDPVMPPNRRNVSKPS